MQYYAYIAEEQKQQKPTVSKERKRLVVDTSRNRFENAVTITLMQDLLLSPDQLYNFTYTCTTLILTSFDAYTFTI